MLGFFSLTGFLIKSVKTFNKKSIDVNGKLIKKNMKKLESNLAFAMLKDAIILHNTGYMYGLGCFYNSLKAVNRISEVKDRSKKGFIVLLSSIDDLKKYTVILTKIQLNLIADFSPGNVTFILKSNYLIPDFLKIDGLTAFRIPQSKSLRKFIEEYKTPIISTSINKSGEQPLNNFDDIQKFFGDKIDFNLCIPDSEIMESSPSTIVKFMNNELVLIREGLIKFSVIKEKYEYLLKNSK